MIQRVSDLEKKIEVLRDDVIDLTEALTEWEQAARRLEEAYMNSDSELDDELNAAIQGILFLIR